VLAALTTADYAILATVAVAVAGFYFNVRVAKADREARAVQARDEHEHVERLARSERTFRSRADAYAEASRSLWTQRLVVWRVNEFAHPDERKYPDLKDPLGEDEWARIMGRVAVYSSPETLAAIEAVRTRMNSMTLAVVALEAAHRVAVREQEEIDSGRIDRGPDYNPWATPEVREAQAGIEECRQRVYEAIDAAEAVMRDELLAI